MNAAIWKRAIRECRLQLAISSVLLILFGWLFVWLMSFFQAGNWASLLNLLPNFMQPMLGVPLALLATPAGQISVLYVHIVTVVIGIGWAIGQASDVVSGEIARGTMEHLATLPLRRVTLIVVPSIVAALGAAVLAASVWLGNVLGLATVGFQARVSPLEFLPGVLNLSAMVFCLYGLTTLFSSWQHDRWQTIKLGGGLFVLSFVLKMIARMWPAGRWLRYGTFLAAFEPQHLILLPADRWVLSLYYDGILLALGLGGLVAAGVIFTCRDLPVPR
jgi:ABC-type transport system involved in multi-copper enzyme maturation permease subunit